MTVKEARNEALADIVIKKLALRNMTGYYAPTKEDALRTALSLIGEGSTVTNGGCMSAEEIGLIGAVKSGNFRYIDRDAAEDKRQAMLDAYDADVYLASCNAISKDGVLVNIDGNSNRVSAIAYGPKKVIFVVGMQKVAPDVDSAIKRARNTAAPLNCTRLHCATPCVKTGSCADCLTPDTICCQFLLTRYSRHKDRIHVILVGEEVGY